MELPAIYAAFASTYTQLVTSRMIRCASTGAMYGGLAMPSAVVLDVSLFELATVSSPEMMFIFDSMVLCLGYGI